VTQSRLSATVMTRVLLRSLLLQASWNFERLQSLGVAYVLAPALHQLYKDEDLALAYARHLEYFNTHPFLAGTVLGITLSLEETRSQGKTCYLEVKEFKNMIMAPYAAMGDAFFWGGVRPLAAAIALFFAFRGSLWAPVVFLLLFNLPHFWFRVVGLLRGYTLGLRAIDDIGRYHLPDLAIRCKEATVILLGALCAYLCFIALRTEEVATGWGLAALPLVAGGGWLIRKGVSALMLVLTVCALVLSLHHLME